MGKLAEPNFLPQYGQLRNGATEATEATEAFPQLDSSPLVVLFPSSSTCCNTILFKLVNCNPT